MKELMPYLPENYRDSPETAAFQNALQPESDAVWAAREALLAQLSPYTATEKGLPYWEDALGLGVCDGLPLDVRRAQIVAKLQGRGPITPAMLRTVAETMLGVPVTVTEVYGEYRVELDVSTGYVPGKEMGQLKERLREILPAHLDFACIVPVLGLLSLTPPPGAAVFGQPRGVLPPRTDRSGGGDYGMGGPHHQPVVEYGPLE